MKNNDSKFNQKPVPLIEDWDEFMERKPTKEQVMKKRDNLENKYFGNKEDNPNN